MNGHTAIFFRRYGKDIILVLEPEPLQNSQGNPSAGVKYTGVEEILQLSPFSSETVRDSPMFTMER